MCAAIFPSDMPHSIPPALAGIRVTGGVNISFCYKNGRSCLANLREWDGYKVRFPKNAGTTEAVIINTGGGVAGGDHVRISADLGEAASATLTIPAAERIYGALGGSTAQIDIDFNIADHARLNWLPQETILFDEARLERSLSVNMAANSTALISETVIFGRVAMGEAIGEAYFRDKWRIRRGSSLIFADNTRLDGNISELLADRAIADGARVMSTSLLIAPDAEERLEPVRRILAATSCIAAASAWNGMLSVRALGADSQSVRRMLEQVLPILSGNSLPRVWSS